MQRPLALFVVIVLFTSLSFASLARAQTIAAPRWFVVQLTLGAAWDKAKPPNQQPGFAEHSANLRALRDAGKLALGARYADKGLLVVRATDAAEARALFDADPMVKGELFALQVDELRVFYPGTVGDAAPTRTLPSQIPPPPTDPLPKPAPPASR